MTEIKTVIQPIEKPHYFDAVVNSHLINGWTLKKREIKKIQGLPNEAFNMSTVAVLYAELER